MLTKLDIAAIRACDAITVHLSSRVPEGLVKAIKRRDYGKPFAEDKEHILPATVSSHNERGADALRNGAQFFAMEHVYWGQHCPTSSVLRTLRVGDEISFSFWPDALSNGYIAAQGLHGDLLRLTVRRDGKRVATWDFSQSFCPENSARMCKGVPVSDDYRRAAEERRAAA